MATMIKRSKALSVRPLKASQPVGATLAFQGMQGAIPMLHGSQGCTAFAKVFFVRHFREPIPLQTTALDQISTVMGADDSIVEGLEVLLASGRTRLVGLLSTGLTEAQGADIHRVVRQFRDSHPQLRATPVVAVNTPDFTGCLETGYAAAVTALVRDLVPQDAPPPVPGMESPLVNVLVGAHLTPGDGDVLKEIIESFGLTPLLLPDLGSAMDGHLADERQSPVSLGGTDPAALGHMGSARATLVVGQAMEPAADLLRQRTGVPDFRMHGLMGLQATDQLMLALSQISGRPVPARYERERRRLQDALLDTHFYLTGQRVALAGDPDQILAWQGLLAEVGLTAPVVVSSTGSRALAESAYATVKIGDLEDLEDLEAQQPVGVFIGNSHLAELAARRHRPLLRCGYPQYDWIGGQTRRWIGYEGARQTLFELANALVHTGVHGVRAYTPRHAA
ncbi:MAG: nitrogenase iron-molybdenum cofactor biosynthesis protein NifN [Magnetococcus sp. WYHC-3]